DLNRFRGGLFLIVTSRRTGSLRPLLSRLRRWCRGAIDSRARRRLFFEEIAKLIFAEFGRSRNQINTRKLPALSSHDGLKKNVGSVGSPRNRITGNARQRTYLPGFAARNRNGIDVLERAIADR